MSFEKVLEGLKQGKKFKYKDCGFMNIFMLHGDVYFRHDDLDIERVGVKTLDLFEKENYNWKEVK